MIIDDIRYKFITDGDISKVFYIRTQSLK